MKTLIVIPARYSSTRFPGKPLAIINGITMIERVYRLARASSDNARIVVATDSDLIANHVKSFSCEVVLSTADYRNGTERVASVLDILGDNFEFVINFQGDAVLTPPWIIKALEEAAVDLKVNIATPATRFLESSYKKFKDTKASGEVGGTTVVFNKKFDALYFSKSIVPFIRNIANDVPLWRHIGIYGYRPEILKHLVQLEPGPLELAEGLEQLRALEHGINIRVIPVDYFGRTHWSVDSIDDLRYCENLIHKEGELI